MKLTGKKLRKVMSIVLAVTLLASLCAVSFGPSVSAAETKTATYTYNFRNYSAFDYQPGSENAHRILGYGGPTDFTSSKTTSLDFWNNSSGPTAYGMLVGGACDFFADTNYSGVNGKLSVRGNNGGDDLEHYGGKGVVVKEGYTYEVSVSFVPLNLTNALKAIKVGIALIQDTDTTESRAIGTKFPPYGEDGIYYGHLTPRAATEWTCDEACNVYRYSTDLIGDFLGNDVPEGYEGTDVYYPMYSNGMSLDTEPDHIMKNFAACKQTLTATYTYGETDLIDGKVVENDLGAHFGVVVGSQGASVGTETNLLLAQIVVTDFSVKVTAPADSTDFEDGDVFHNGEEIAMASFGSTDVEIVDGYATAPAAPEGFNYWSSPSNELVFAGDRVAAAHGDVFTARKPPNIATDPCFSYRTDGTIGIRARGTVKLPTQKQIDGGGGAGFVLVPLAADPAATTWFSTGEYRLLVPIEDLTQTYDGSSGAGGTDATYQVCLTGLPENLKGEKFLIAMYIKTRANSGYKYYYIGCESFDSIVANSAE